MPSHVPLEREQRKDRDSSRSTSAVAQPALGKTLAITPSNALAMQRLAGNHAVSNSVAQRKSPASGSVATGNVIQRELDFKPENLGGSLSLGARIKGFFGADSTYAQIQQILARYWRVANPSAKMMALEELRALGNQWLTRHKDPEKDGDKRESITRMVEKVNDEIAVLEPTLQADRAENERYLENLKNGNLNFLTNSGADQSKNLERKSKNRKDKTTKLTKEHGLSLAESSAIGIYTSDDYKYINPAMAGNEGWMKGQLPKTDIANKKVAAGVGKNPSQKHLDVAAKEGKYHGNMAMKGMGKLPDWQGTTYRGMGMDEAQVLAQYHQGATVDYPAFTSTSISRSVAEGFAAQNANGGKVGVLFTYKLTKGKDVQEFSPYPEAEILLMAGSKFQVTKVETSEDDFGGKIYEITAQQVK